MSRPSNTHPRVHAGAYRAPYLKMGIALLLGLAFAHNAFADEGRRKTELYLAGFAGGAWMEADATGTNNANGTPNGGSSTDASPFGGAALGVTFDLHIVDLRLELEGTGGRAFTFSTPSGAGAYSTRIDTWTLQGNFWFEYRLSRLFPDVPVISRLAPLGGGGLGLAQHKIRTTDGNVAGEDDRSAFAWQGGVGLAYHAGDKMAFEARYQYTDFGEPTVNLRNAGGGQGTLGQNLGGNEFVATLRFTY